MINLVAKYPQEVINTPILTHCTEIFSVFLRMTVSNNCKLETTFTTIKAVSSIAVLEIYRFYTNIAFLKEHPCISMHYDRVRKPNVFFFLKLFWGYENGTLA